MIALQEEIFEQVNRAAAIANLLEYYSNDHTDEFPDALRDAIPSAVGMLANEIRGIREAVYNAPAAVAKEPMP